MFKLIDLPYTSLAPVISDQTLAFHHGKHLQTYVDNLNKLIVGTEFEALCHSELSSCHSERSEESVLEEIVKKSSGAIFNNAGQILNHNLYFTQFAPQPPLPAPTGNLAKQIAKQWGTLDAFKADFESKGTTLFGSGWVWLQANEEGELSIAQYANADNPVAHVMPGSTGHLKPLLTFDVWEHAYYLDYQNRRAAHLSVLWQIVDWAVIVERFTK
ncbi:MAG: superoxide dismutase [Bacteroidales bacterium]|nr:superoxide dismutase [Bacteroidales bacterium]